MNNRSSVCSIEKEYQERKENIMKKSFKLENLCCANCAAKIEHEASKLDGVKSLNISFMTSKLKVEADDENFEAVLESVEKVIKKIEPDCYIVK